MKIATILMVLLIVFWTEVESGEIPPDAINFAIGKVDSWFSCSRFDGFAACYHNDSEKRDRICYDSSCGRQDSWEYEPWFGGDCYCCKC